jgi:hypothetical protein
LLIHANAVVNVIRRAPKDPLLPNGCYGLRLHVGYIAWGLVTPSYVNSYWILCRDLQGLAFEGSFSAAITS